MAVHKKEGYGAKIPLGLLTCRQKPQTYKSACIYKFKGTHVEVHVG